MSKQSERQLGAFAALYVFETGAFPDFLNPSRLQVKFRNDVVHAGKIPTRDEALKYVNLVHSLIRHLLIELHVIAPGHLTRDLDNRREEVASWAYDKDYTFLDYAFQGMFGIDRFSPEKIAEADQLYQANKASGTPPLTGSYESLRTDLGFEDTLRARQWYLDKQFTKGKDRGSGGTSERS